jgi:hypothetical protein
MRAAALAHPRLSDRAADRLTGAAPPWRTRMAAFCRSAPAVLGPPPARATSAAASGRFWWEPCNCMSEPLWVAGRASTAHRPRGAGLSRQPTAPPTHSVPGSENTAHLWSGCPARGHAPSSLPRALSPGARPVNRAAERRPRVWPARITGCSGVGGWSAPEPRPNPAPALPKP